MSTAKGISAEAVVKSYARGKPVLRGVGLDVSPGETLGLIGPNGAGKTTFFGCLLGLLTPDEGRVLIDGESPDSIAVRGKIGYVPERQTFDLWMTGARYLAYHHGLARRPVADRAREVEAVYERVGLPLEAFGRRMRSYSRGMLQRIGIAQALIAKPRYLFLDEPTSGMDPTGVLLVRHILEQLHGEGTTIVFNSHQLDQLERICDRVAFMREGRLDSVQDLAARNDAKRTVIVRFVPEDGDAARLDVSLDGVERLANATDTRFRVRDDEACALLVRTLVTSGLRVLEVVPVEGRLERLFTSETQR